MYENSKKFRVRYAETDQMGVVYYGNYPIYLEVGRVEALRNLGLTYKQMEEDGVMLPVLNLQIKYLKSAVYDEEINVVTKITKLPSSRINFEHEIYNEAGDLITLGQVELVFVSMQTRKPCRCPKDLLDLLKPFFNELKA